MPLVRLPYTPDCSKFKVTTEGGQDTGLRMLKTFPGRKNVDLGNGDFAPYVRDKMKKEFDALIKALPGWAKKRTIMILADQEMLAMKIPRQKALIKKTRCVQCGECCLDVPDRQTPRGSDEEGKCNALKKDRDKWICTAGLQKPFTCLTDPLKGNAPRCKIEYF